jgi:putative transposase
LPAYRRPSRRAEALVAQAYLAGVNTRRVRRALAGLFAGRVGTAAVSRAWRRARSAREAWRERDLAGEGVVRLILDGTAVEVRPDKRVTAVSLLVALGVRRDGREVVLAIGSMGGESEAAWRQVLEGLASRGLGKPGLVIVDGGKGLEAALAAVGDDVPVQRCAVHKERNLLAHAPEHLHEEVKADFRDVVHARSKAEVLAKREAFLAKWTPRCRAVAESLDEAGERLFTFLRYPPEQWRSLRTTNAIERLREEFERRLKTRTALPSAETAATLFRALLASGQITPRKVDGWQSLAQAPGELDLAA